MPKLGNFVEDSETLSRNFEVFATIIGKCQSHIFKMDMYFLMQQLGCCLTLWCMYAPVHFCSKFGFALKQDTCLI